MIYGCNSVFISMFVFIVHVDIDIDVDVDVDDAVLLRLFKSGILMFDSTMSTTVLLELGWHLSI